LSPNLTQDFRSGRLKVPPLTAAARMKVSVAVVPLGQDVTQLVEEVSKYAVSMGN